MNAFLLAEFTSPAERDVEFLIGSDDADVIWLNGEKVHEDRNSSGWTYDEFHVKAHVKSGKNVVVARCGNNSGAWQFSLSISGERKGKLFETVAAKKPDRDAYARFALDHKGNAANGNKIFHNVQTVGCLKCHQIGPNDGGPVGPSLAGVGAKYDRAKLIESVVYPSKQIFDGYEQWAVKTKRRRRPVPASSAAESEGEITMFDSAAQKMVIKKSDIVSRKKSEISLMPEGLEQGLTPAGIGGPDQLPGKPEG